MNLDERFLNLPNYFFGFLAHWGSNDGLLLLQCLGGISDAPKKSSGVSTRCNCRVLILASSQSFH